MGSGLQQVKSAKTQDFEAWYDCDTDWTISRWRGETLGWKGWLVGDDAGHYSTRKYRYRRDRRERSLKVCRRPHEYLNTMYKKIGIGAGGVRVPEWGVRVLIAFNNVPGH